MKVSGFGVITIKGLDIFDYCKVSEEQLQFTNFLVTNKQLSLSVLADSNDATYGHISKPELLEELSASDYYEGVISSTDTNLITEDSSYLPLLLSILSNDYSEDLSIYTIFLLAKDYETKRLKIATPANFVIGNTTTCSNGATGLIDYIDVAEKEIYVTNITPNFLGVDFIVGMTVQDDVVGVSENISAVDYSEYSVYMGCPAYNEVQDFYVNDVAGFAIGNTVTTTGGASGEVLDINSNVLTISRNNILRFAVGDTLTNSVVTTTIISDPSVNLTDSTILPLSYISDGADLLLRISLRSTSGFPRNISFLSTAIMEINIHDASDSSHLDFRLMSALYTADVAYTLRLLKSRVDAIVSLNNLIDGQ